MYHQFQNIGDSQAVNFDDAYGNSGGITVQRNSDDEHNVEFTVNMYHIPKGCPFWSEACHSDWRAGQCNPQ